MSDCNAINDKDVHEIKVKVWVMHNINEKLSLMPWVQTNDRIQKYVRTLVLEAESSKHPLRFDHN